jgi:hypothetical protein
MSKNVQNDAQKALELWAMRLRMTQQIVFSVMQETATTSGSRNLRLDLEQVWLSGFDMTRERMLPDRRVALGAPTDTDLQIRDSMVELVNTNLSAPQSPYKIELECWSQMKALIGHYTEINTLLKGKWGAVEASKLETKIYHALRGEVDRETALNEPFTDEDLANCPL